MVMSRKLLWSKTPAVTRYALAIVSVGLSILICSIVETRWKSAPFVAFNCAIMPNAWFGGFGPGLLSIALSILAFNYFFLLPFHSLLVNANEVPRLNLFALAALIVSLLSAAQGSSAESLRRARDTLALKVQELERAIAERNQAQGAFHKAQAELTHTTGLTTMGELTASIPHEMNPGLRRGGLMEVDYDL
jgi:K+-sensing histidine kinase KdpD